MRTIHFSNMRVAGIFFNPLHYLSAHVYVHTHACYVHVYACICVTKLSRGKRGKIFYAFNVIAIFVDNKLLAVKKFDCTIQDATIGVAPDLNT
jgi:hypothetical protein